MHAKVFQITKQRVNKENTLDENTLTQGDGSYYDYCSEISDETRKEMIDYLVNELLPKGMFTLVGIDEDTDFDMELSKDFIREVEKFYRDNGRIPTADELKRLMEKYDYGCHPAPDGDTEPFD